MRRRRRPWPGTPGRPAAPSASPTCGWRCGSSSPTRRATPSTSSTRRPCQMPRSSETQRLRQMLEALIERVDVPDAGERDALRDAYARLCEEGLDRSGVLRTHAVRLLGREPETRDRDLFVEAARTFCRDTGVDTSAELRGLALLALSRVD